MVSYTDEAPLKVPSLTRSNMLLLDLLLPALLLLFWEATDRVLCELLMTAVALGRLSLSSRWIARVRARASDQDRELM